MVRGRFFFLPQHCKLRCVTLHSRRSLYLYGHIPYAEFFPRREVIDYTVLFYSQSCQVITIILFYMLVYLFLHFCFVCISQQVLVRPCNCRRLCDSPGHIPFVFQHVLLTLGASQSACIVPRVQVPVPLQPAAVFFLTGLSPRVSIFLEEQDKVLSCTVWRARLTSDTSRLQFICPTTQRSVSLTITSSLPRYGGGTCLLFASRTLALRGLKTDCS